MSLLIIIFCGLRIRDFLFVKIFYDLSLGFMVEIFHLRSNYKMLSIVIILIVYLSFISTLSKKSPLILLIISQ